jgi:PIN domain nuclease of toxin-antitoxin system
MTIVLDASAVLAHILGESGSDRVDTALGEGAVCSAVTWAEVVQHTTRHGVSRSALSAYAQVTGLMIEPLTQGDAEAAGGMFAPGDGLSLGDRCCLALAERLDTTALTADRQWAGRPSVEVIR